MDKIAILKEILEHLISHQGMGLKSALDESKKPKEIDVEMISPVKEGSYDDKVDQAIKDSHGEEEKPDGEMTDDELEELLNQHSRKKG